MDELGRSDAATWPGKSLPRSMTLLRGDELAS